MQAVQFGARGAVVVSRLYFCPPSSQEWHCREASLRVAEGLRGIRFGTREMM